MRRARQRAAYAARKEARAAQDVIAPAADSLASTGAVVSEVPAPEQIAASVADARALLARTGAQQGRMFGADEQGWDQATEHGIACEAAVRQVGGLMAARADHLAAGRLAEVDAHWKQEIGAESPAEHAERCTAESARARARMEEYSRLAREAKRAGDVDQARAFFEQANSEVQHYNETAREAHQYSRGSDPWSLARAEVMADAYQQVLAEQRPLGMPAEGLVVHPTSQRPAVKRLEAAMAYYPTDWIEDSNRPEKVDNGYGVAERLLRVRTTRGRAYYAHEAHVEREEKVTRPQERLVPADAPLPEGAVDTGDVVTAVEYMPGSFMEVKNLDRHDPDQIRRVRRVTVPVSGIEYTRDEVSELLVDKTVEGCQEPGVSTALHEFGHRAEQLRPQIADLERVFLARRTTGEDGTRDRLTRYLGKGNGPVTAARWTGKGEFVREDSFATAYVGKEYGPNVHAREVFTVGMEGLFAGKYGGFTGNAKYRKDLEHRDLVLGILATT